MRWFGWFWMAAVLPPAWAAGFELRGRVEGLERHASVTLHGATSPYTSAVAVDRSGRFRFRELQAGAYTLSVFVPGRGEVRRTVTVGPSSAGGKGRVELTLVFEPSGASEKLARKESAAVPLRRLSIPDRARQEFERAQKRLEKREVEAAVGHLEKAVEIAPQFVAAWNNLGTIAYQTSRYEEAAGYFRQALEQEAGAYAPSVNLGGTLLNLGKPAEALHYNLYSVAQRPDDALANSQLGINYFQLGEQQRAIQYLNVAKKLDPAHFSLPQLLLARIFLGRGQLEEGRAELEDFLRQHPDAPQAPEVRKQLQWLEKMGSAAAPARP